MTHIARSFKCHFFLQVSLGLSNTRIRFRIKHLQEQHLTLNIWQLGTYSAYQKVLSVIFTHVTLHFRKTQPKYVLEKFHA